MNEEFNETRRDLVGAIEAWAVSNPEAPALLLDREAVSFSELNVRANRVANGLQELGVKKGDRVAVMLPNIPEFVYAFAGTLKLGAVAVPFNTLYKGGEILHILKDSGAKVLFALTNFAPMINEIRPELPDLEQVILTGERNLLFAHPDNRPWGMSF
jgi:acyl-CoA synthetase (AMP-forming)/AMP-acid ligase II